MNDELRITLIATGFASTIGLAEASREDEQTQLLKSLKSDEELDVPSFLRRPLFGHRRQVITPPTKLIKTPLHTPAR
jgi:cell division protein FtsZ